MEQLLTPQQIADKLSVKLSTIYNWSHIGFIPHIKLGGALRFDEAQVIRWLERRSIAGRLTRKQHLL